MALPKVCELSGKHTYPDWDTAVRYALRRSKRTGLALRIYGCGCGGFHLTRRALWVERWVA